MSNVSCDERMLHHTKQELLRRVALFYVRFAEAVRITGGVEVPYADGEATDILDQYVEYVRRTAKCLNAKTSDVARKFTLEVIPLTGFKRDFEEKGPYRIWMALMQTAKGRWHPSDRDRFADLWAWCLGNRPNVDDPFKKPIDLTKTTNNIQRKKRMTKVRQENGGKGRALALVAGLATAGVGAYAYHRSRKLTTSVPRSRVRQRSSRKPRV